MTTLITQQDDHTVITLDGRLDTPATPQVEEAVRPLMNDAAVKNVLIDCTNLSYISSSGLRIFITLQKHFLKTGGILTLSHLTPTVQAVFEMTGFSSIFTIE